MAKRNFNNNDYIPSSINKLNLKKIIESSLQDEYTDETPYPIKGQYFGHPIGDVPASHLLWVEEQSWFKSYPEHTLITEYINSVRNDLEKELFESKKKFYDNREVYRESKRLQDLNLPKGRRWRKL